MPNETAGLDLPDRLPLPSVAALLGVAPNTARKLGERGEFRLFRIGKRRFADRASVVAYFDRLRGETNAAA